MEKKFKGKTIILAITPDIDIYKCFVDNLEFLGFEVYLLCNTEKFKYENLTQRLTNTFRKVFLNDKYYKRECSRHYFESKNLSSLAQYPDVDFSLTIRPDLFSKTVLETIISKSSKSYAYQWDGLNRFPEVKNVISLFDKFYVFDKTDLNCKQKVYFTTNCYFDCYNTNIKNEHHTPEYDAFFIGSFDSRIDKLIAICEFLISKGLKLNIVLCCSPKKELKKYPYIRFIKKRLSYLENLKLVYNSKMIIDIHYDSLHHGLSLRTFEALGNNKKIITTNQNIKEYDFFDKKNIFILNNDNSEFDSFWHSKFELKSSDTRLQYGFTNWINTILEQ